LTEQPLFFFFFFSSLRFGRPRCLVICLHKMSNYSDAYLIPRSTMPTIYFIWLFVLRTISSFTTMSSIATCKSEIVAFFSIIIIRDSRVHIHCLLCLSKSRTFSLNSRFSLLLWSRTKLILIVSSRYEFLIISTPWILLSCLLFPFFFFFFFFGVNKWIK
jgi:hypothetical protein